MRNKKKKLLKAARKDAKMEEKEEGATETVYKNTGLQINLFFNIILLNSYLEVFR